MPTITIPTSLTSIGAYAFEACNDLTSMYFGFGVNLRRFQTGTFHSSGLINVTLPSSIEDVGDSAFAHTTNMMYVSVEPQSQLTSIGIQAFYFSGLKSIYIPASLNYIHDIGNPNADAAFKGCSYFSVYINDKNTLLSPSIYNRNVGTSFFGMYQHFDYKC